MEVVVGFSHNPPQSAVAQLMCLNASRPPSASTAASPALGPPDLGPTGVGSMGSDMMLGSSTSVGHRCWSQHVFV